MPALCSRVYASLKARFLVVWGFVGCFGVPYICGTSLVFSSLRINFAIKKKIS